MLAKMGIVSWLLKLHSEIFFMFQLMVSNLQEMAVKCVGAYTH